MKLKNIGKVFILSLLFLIILNSVSAGTRVVSWCVGASNNVGGAISYTIASDIDGDLGAKTFQPSSAWGSSKWSECYNLTLTEGWHYFDIYATTNHMGDVMAFCGNQSCHYDSDFVNYDFEGHNTNDSTDYVMYIEMGNYLNSSHGGWIPAFSDYNFDSDKETVRSKSAIYTSGQSWGYNIFVASAGGGGPAPEWNSINCTTPEPNQYTYFNTNEHQINLSCNASTTFSKFNATLYLNGVLNETKEYDTGNDRKINFSLKFDDGNYTYNINTTVWNADDTLNDSEKTNDYSFVIDTHSPTLVHNFTNRTILFNKNLSGSFNFSDNIGLHSVNFSVNGIPIFNITNLQGTTYNYSLNYQPTKTGWNNLTIIRADGHTALELEEPYKESNGLFNDYLKYEFPEGGEILTENKNPSIFDDWESIKYKDRYKQIYRPATPGYSQTFVETSDLPIYIWDKPGHYGDKWIVVGKHWKDYVVENEPLATVSIKRIDKYNVEVTISGLVNSPEEIHLNSIGDLNIVTEELEFFYGNVSTIYTDGVINGGQQSIYFNVSKDTGVTTSANLIYNGSLKNSTVNGQVKSDYYTSTFNTHLIDTRNATLNFYWNYTVVGPENTETGILNASQQVFKYYLDNCSNFTTRALNVSFINISDSTPVNVDVTLSAEGITNYYDSFSSVNSFGLCIYPSFTNITEQINIQYSDGVNYYYNAEYYLSNVTQTLTLYTQTASDTTTFTIKDRDTSQTLENAYVTMYRRISGTWVVMESKYSDITGRAQFTFNPSVEYKFFISKNGYEPYTFQLNPIIFDSYDILMNPSFTSNFTADYGQVAFYYEPRIFYDNQLNNFTFNIHSPDGELNTYGYTLIFPGGSESNSGVNPIGEELTSVLNISGSGPTDKVQLSYYYSTDISGLRNFNYDFEIIAGPGNNTMIMNKDKTYGMGIFERIFISVFLVLMVVGIATLVGQPLAGLGLGLILYGYLVYIGFMPLWSILITVALGLIILGSNKG